MSVIKLYDIASKGEVEMKVAIQKVLLILKKISGIIERRRWILPSVLSVVLFAVAIWGIENFNQFLLYDDEFGYWTASAYLTGTDWKSVTSGIPYYSYGYGFLILTPIRLLISTPSDMYRAAIVVNVLLLVGSYWIARNVANQLFEDAHWALIDVICFVVMLYPSNLVFSHIAWAECTLVFVFWVFVWLSLRVIKKPSLMNHVGMAFVVMGLYVVHQRTMAVAIATVMVMMWCFYLDKSRRKKIIGFVAVMVVLIVVHSAIKNDLIDEFYCNNLKVDANNLEGHTDKLTGIFTGEGFLALVKSMIGKWFYLFVATFLMAWWGAEFLFKKTGAYIKEIYSLKTKNRKKEYAASDMQPIWYIWILLAFGGNFFIAALFMNGGARNDMLVYGRYNEYMIGIYLIIGIMAFLKDEKWVSKLMYYIPITLFCAWICQNITDALSKTEYQAYHSICTSLFMEKGKSPDGSIMAFAIIGLTMSVIFIWLMKADSAKHSNKIRKGMVVAAVSVFWIVTAYQMVFGVMTDKQCLRIVNIQNIVNWIEQVDQNFSRDIYYCSDTESRYWSESFQFFLDDKPLSVIKSSQIDQDEDSFYIVGNEFLQSEDFNDNYYCIKETNQFALIVNKDGELAKEVREVKGE